ncbi:MAG: hypothetical protein MZV64_71675 [Ignavibacteriales bacterium]|nr:hypothetical protein [Ignavibacteriales bacterium]
MPQQSDQLRFGRRREPSSGSAACSNNSACRAWGRIMLAAFVGITLQAKIRQHQADPAVPVTQKSAVAGTPPPTVTPLRSGSSRAADG